MKPAFFGLFALVLSAACAPGAGARPQIAYVTNGAARFWTIGAAGAMAGAEVFDVDCDVRMPDGSVDQQRILEDLVTRGVDGIAVSPIDPRNQIGLLNQVCAHTRVITQDSDAPGSDRLCFVGPDNYLAGRTCGQLVKEALPGGGSVILFVGRLEQDNGRLRRQGLIDELMGWTHEPSRYSAPGSKLSAGPYEILDTRTDQFDRSRAKQNAEDALARHPDLSCMVGLFAYNPPLMLEALKGAGKLGQVKVVAFDEADETLQGILDGTVYGTVVQQPYEYGYHSVRILGALARDDQTVLPAEGFYDLPAQAIRKDNCRVYWDDLQKKLQEGQG